MKAQSGQQPPATEDLGRQKRFNFNVQKESTDEGTFYKYECVVSDNNRNALIAALIRRKYTADDELALINNAEDGEQKHVDEYNEYQAFRSDCKNIANQFFPK